MPSTKEIRNRINSVSNIQKITSAMYLISSTKLRKAKDSLEHTRPFFDTLEYEIKRIFQSKQHADSNYFYPMEGRHKAESYAYLVITADKGLAGAYNMNVIKRAEKELEKHKKTKLYVVGEFGRRYFKKHNIPIEQSFLYTAQNPTFQRAREISWILLEQYNAGNVDEIRVIYSDMKNALISDVCMNKLLPFERREFLVPKIKEAERDLHYKFTPSVEHVLDSIIPGYIASFVFGALVDSFCAEQNARMNAMSAANENALELLSDLESEYNKVRQGAITQEITEIAAGARAQKKKKLKKLLLRKKKRLNSE